MNHVSQLLERAFSRINFNLPPQDLGLRLLGKPPAYRMKVMRDYVRPRPADFVDCQKVQVLLLRRAEETSDHRREQLTRSIRFQRLVAARARGTHTLEEWLAIRTTLADRCAWCACRPDPWPTKDHIVPLCLGGDDSASNIQPLCRTCNTASGHDCIDWGAYRRAHGFSA